MYRLLERYPRLAEFLDRLSTIILANLLWMVMLIPIVTIPAATAGLFAAMAPLSRGQPSDLFPDFFEAVRHRWRESTVIFLLDIVIGVVVAGNFVMLVSTEIPVLWLLRVVSISIAILTLLLNLYIWPLMVFSKMPLRGLVTTSFQLMVVHPFWSVGLLLVTFIPVGLGLLFRNFVVLAAFSSLALLVNAGAWRIIRRYV